jgi:sterol 24-C-methyltransferase
LNCEGGVFGSYEWCLTDNFDSKNPQHLEIKKKIEIGNGLPDLINTRAVDRALKEVASYFSFFDIQGWL